MKNSSQDSFIRALQQHAQQQSKLEETSPLPSFTQPASVILAQYPWQTLLFISFISAWFLLLWGFEFFFRIVHNIAI